MATLKDHQQAMVDLLASGSGIPASASRLAHAMHDVLGILLLQSAARENATDIRALFGLDDATTPGLNDKALADDVKACHHKQEIKESMLRAKESRIKALENTVKPLRASNAELRKDNKWLKCRISASEDDPEQAGCRKPDTQVCERSHAEYRNNNRELICLACGKDIGV
ncbi:hypothetical protein G3156_004408 [Salmonella enterica subsp. enterica serovar Montevideo]|nr:hypothetical protein [Salmonella enterica subsp. enterica serovar Montevideo]EEO3278657.1 hypothetical protein [Salmonella enterica subsp. enterica serovar Rubislaw]